MRNKMRKIPRSGWLAAALLAALLFGCNNNEGQVGGPGADVPTDGDTEPEAEERTFTATVSAENLELVQGRRQELTFTLERGSEFTEPVDVEFDVPHGVNILPDRVTMDAGQSETTVLVEADDNADTQEYALEITFQPNAGESVVKVVKVVVTEPESTE